MLVSLNQTIAVLGNSTPHGHEMLDFIESRHIANLVSITPDTHDLALGLAICLFNLMIKGNIDTPPGIPISAVQVHTLLSSWESTGFHDLCFGSCVTDGQVCERSGEVEAAGAGVGAADVEGVVSCRGVCGGAGDVEVEPGGVFGCLSLSARKGERDRAVGVWHAGVVGFVGGRHDVGGWA